ncbi:MAG: nuclear transport factor 2 family protein [Acidobacteriia bacterium]|nr:nuclear transport factor 2 family protein [Terriglobia bacterium]
MSVSSAAEYEAWKAQTEESRRVVQMSIDALNRGDAVVFLGSFSDDLHFEMPGYTPVSGKTKGLQDFTELVTKVAGYLSVLITIRATFFLAAGEWVVTRADGHGVTKHRKNYDNHYCHLWRVRNGKIVEFVEYNDTQLIMDVLCAKENRA